MGVLLKKTMSVSDAGKAGILGKSRGTFTMCMYVCADHEPVDECMQE